MFFHRGWFGISQHISLISAWTNTLQISTLFICFTSFISLLFTWFLIISRIVSQIDPLVISSSPILSHIVYHLCMRSLNWIISCITFNIISRNSITSSTLHHRITILSSLRRMVWSQHHHHHHHGLHPFIIHLSACHILFLHVSSSAPLHFSTKSNMQGPVPYHARSRSLSCRFLFTYVMVRSLTCKVLFLVMLRSLSCKVPFLVVSVPVHAWHDPFPRVLSSVP